MKQSRNPKESELCNKLDFLINLEGLSSEEELEMNTIQLELGLIYLDLVKGPSIRSWLEEGEKNTWYFFAAQMFIPISLQKD